MNKANINTYITELESKIQILERENEALSLKAEENLLLSRAFEEINSFSDIDDLLLGTLESICIIKNIQFGALIECCNNVFKCINSYALFTNNECAEIQLKVTNKIQKKITNNESCYANNSDIELHFNNSESKFNSSSYLIIPLKSENLSNRYVIFADDSNGADLEANLPFLEKVVNLIASRIERIKYQVELTKLYEKLKGTNDKLVTINQELNKKNEIIIGQNTVLQKTLENLKETRAQLVQSEKMASIGILLSGIAHEINNPLNFIQGGKTAIELLLDDHEDLNPDEINTYIDMITEGLERVTKIIGGLSRFNRQTDNYGENCEVNLIIENCLTILQNQIRHDVNVNLNLSKKLKPVKGNEGELHQAILNILTNAIQAVEKGGTIDIETKLMNNIIHIKISDNGCGIPAENIKKVTDPFFTTKDPGKGTGLGLSIVYSIIEKHGGDLNFKSELNKGTCVKIKLPIKS